MNIYEAFFELIRAGLFGDDVSEETRALFKDEEKTMALCKLSSKHDIAHLVGGGIEKAKISGVSPEISKGFNQAQFLAIYRYENIKYEFDRILSLFDRENIDCIVLKGSVLRRYYPEPWMRTSCDIDILIHDEDSERAIGLLEKEYGYTLKGKNYHDYQLFSQNGVHLELHFDLIEEGAVLKAEEVLDSVWSNTVLLNGYKCVYEMNDEMFYYYHVIHLAKHLLIGGCGVRPILDMYIINKITEHSPKAYELLKEGSLDILEKKAAKLSRVWFANEKGDESTDRLTEFILRGGVYGNTKNRVAINKEDAGGTFKYAIHRIFLPYKYMVVKYPGLEKHKWMFPLYQVKRWFDLLFKGRAAYSFNELKTNQTISSDEVEKIKMMIEDLGLK